MLGNHISTDKVKLNILQDGTDLEYRNIMALPTSHYVAEGFGQLWTERRDPIEPFTRGSDCEDLRQGIIAKYYVYYCIKVYRLHF